MAFGSLEGSLEGFGARGGEEGEGVKGEERCGGWGGGGGRERGGRVRLKGMR